MRGGTRVEIVAVGDELLLGDSIDSNGPWLGRRLSGLGAVVSRRTVVGDDDAAIRGAVADALGRTGIVICSGGLGPTPDDRTRDAVAGLYGREFELDGTWLETIRRRFQARGLVMPDTNRRQAEVPRGAVLLPNPHGTAPGLAIDDARLGLTVLLPGPPRELRALFDAEVTSLLEDRLDPERRPVLRRVLRTTGLAESQVAERVADLDAGMAPLTLAYLPVGIGIDLRLTSWGVLSADEAGRALDAAQAALTDRLGAAVYAEGETDLAAVVGHALAERGLTVATAESCTGGLVAKRLTDVAGASAWVRGGAVAYSNEAKRDALGVPAELIAGNGAVSEPVVRAMVEGAQARLGADCAVAVTGIAGPGGGTAEKPVGTVWIAASVRDRIETRLLRLVGTRGDVRARSAQAALALLLGMLREPA
ncbi:MAG: competence/damage-inducible protein A [Gemmatimonadota bacterium]|jgi:nicotinamide-nucleotide amidase